MNDKYAWQAVIVNISAVAAVWLTAFYCPTDIGQGSWSGAEFPELSRRLAIIAAVIVTLIFIVSIYKHLQVAAAQWVSQKNADNAYAASLFAIGLCFGIMVLSVTAFFIMWMVTVFLTMQLWLSVFAPPFIIGFEGVVFAFAARHFSAKINSDEM